MEQKFKKDIQYYKFCLYGFLKNLRFFEPFLILFFTEKGISFSQIGVLYAIKFIVREVFEIPSGIFADIFGRRGSMVFSYSCYICSFLVYYFSANYYILIIATFLFGLGDAFRTGTHKAMIFQYLKINNWNTQKVHYYGHTRSWSQFGSAISSIVAALLVFYSGDYRSIFLYTILPYLIGLGFLISYPKTLEGEKPKSISMGDLIKETLQRIFTSFKSTFTIKAIINVSSFSGYFMAIKDYLQVIVQYFIISIPVLLWMTDKQKNAITLGLIYFIIYLLSSVSSHMSGRFSDKFKSLPVVLNITLIIGLFISIWIGLFSQIEWFLAAAVGFILLHMLENIRRPQAVACVTEIFPDHILASVLSVESQARTVLAAIIAPLLGLFIDLYGIGIGIITITIILSLLYRFIMFRKNK